MGSAEVNKEFCITLSTFERGLNPTFTAETEILYSFYNLLKNLNCRNQLLSYFLLSFKRVVILTIQQQIKRDPNLRIFYLFLLYSLRKILVNKEVKGKAAFIIKFRKINNSDICAPLLVYLHLSISHSFIAEASIT